MAMASRPFATTVRCGAEPSSRRNMQRIRKDLPAPLPPRVAPPRPPPPRRKKKTWYWDGEGPTRRGILAGLIGGGFLSWNLQRSRFPRMYQDKNGNLYVRTNGGNYLGVDFDESGRMFLIDKGGNIYYDTGFDQGGVTVMTRDGEMYNMFTDKDGSVAKIKLGNRKDIATIETPEFGEVTAFVDKKLPEALAKPKEFIEGEVPLPPVKKPPPVIDEGLFFSK